jgi:predicted alpha-1,2-mannosidase
MNGLIGLMGGQKTFISMLDSVCTISPNYGSAEKPGDLVHEQREMQVMGMGQYAHGNQPIQHMLYLYNYVGQPWKSQYWVRRAMDKLYKPTSDGYCGDEDNGQTSAWYVMSALGFYPVCPGTNEYVTGTPLFKSVTINLENGKKLVINAKNNSADNFYIKSMKVNGAKYEKNYFTHTDLKNGATINLEMSATPNLQRGTKAADYPYSLSN